jgi:hypothetical protein
MQAKQNEQKQIFGKLCTPRYDEIPRAFFKRGASFLSSSIGDLWS